MPIARLRRAGFALALLVPVFACALSAPARAEPHAPASDGALATLCGIVEDSAKNEGLPVDFFIRLIWRESAFEPKAVSPAGAQGVAQFMPGTAAERGLADPFDPAAAIPASAKLLADLARRFGNLGLAAAAYNAGPNALQKWLSGEGFMPIETQDYVMAITGRDLEDWRGPKPAGRGLSGPGRAVSRRDLEAAHGARALGRAGRLRPLRPLGGAALGELRQGLGVARLRPRPARIRERDRRHAALRAGLGAAQPGLAALLPRAPAGADGRRGEAPLRPDSRGRRGLRGAAELSGPEEGGRPCPAG